MLIWRTSCIDVYIGFLFVRCIARTYPQSFSPSQHFIGHLTEKMKTSGLNRDTVFVPAGSGIEEAATDFASWRGRQRYRILKPIVVSFWLDSVYLTLFWTPVMSCVSDFTNNYMGSVIIELLGGCRPVHYPLPWGHDLSVISFWCGSLHAIEGLTVFPVWGMAAIKELETSISRKCKKRISVN
jgi:hypothetical protein